MIPLLSLGACANLVLLEIAGDLGVPGIVFLLPLFLCLIGVAAAAGVARRERLDGE